MKKLIPFLFVILSFTTYGQTADEIISKYAAAMGGLDAFNKIETAKISGSLITQGMTLPITTQIINGKSMRTDVTVNGQVISNVYDKGKGWKVNPYENVTEPAEVTSPDELAAYKVQASLANNLMDYKKRGHTVELIGQENIDGVMANKLKLVSKDDGKTTVYYISTTDNLLIRSDSRQKIQGNEFDAVTTYADFKNFGNLKFSTHFIRKIQGQTFQEVKYENIELNVKVDESIFKMPK